MGLHQHGYRMMLSPVGVGVGPLRIGVRLEFPSMGTTIFTDLDHRKGAMIGGKAHAVDQPNVNAKASTPESRNSISNCRSAIGFRCRIS